ncbi:helix-turn-helix domain-containing protein [Sediminibacterium sp.]|uniref:helix-turn-helix domain-containing protein n=1 Tax=Sediminibacterium sp. TaxID=1917865 RepID=UPI0035253523
MKAMTNLVEEFSLMEYIYPINNISQYNADNNHKTLHPLVTVIDFSKASLRDWGNVTSIKFQYGMYCIYLKDVKCGDMKYGRHLYDYQAGTLAFFAPGQVMEMQKPSEPYQPLGYGLIFHADFLLGTSLGKRINDYQFFDYETNEALHLSEDERAMIISSFVKIQFELNQPIDKHSKKLIAANIELFLDYCQRFYDRQFITRENINKGILAQFEQLLKDYFNSDQPQRVGIPSVAYFAQALHLSANYFGDLIKKETGQSAKDYLQNKTIETAKKRMFETNKNINEISMELGFKYPQHFTRLFKQKVGVSPLEFRNSN